jgi:eukaryotic-like serine/threonine-protein kinase
MITGTHLTSTTSVRFAGRPATFTVLTPAKVRAIVPATAISGTVTLTTNLGSTESRVPFTVTTGLVTTPRYAGPGEPVAASGSGFPPSADVVLDFDGVQVAAGRTNAAGGFQALDFTVPDAPFGPHDLVAVSGAFSFPIKFLVESDWAFGRHDVAGSGNDGSENTLSSSNVGSMVKHWSFTLASSPATPVEAGGVVYLGDASGDFYAVDATTGKQKWMVQPGNQVGGAAAVDGNTVFVGDGFTLFALNTANGKIRWSIGTSGTVLRSPAVSSNTVYFTSWNGSMQTLYSLNETSGAVNWTRPLSTSTIGGSPALSSADVYVADYSGTMYAVNRSTGKLDWKKSVGGSPGGTPDIANGEVYVVATGSSTHQVWDLNGLTGAKIWADNEFPSYNSAAYDNHAIFLTTTGELNSGVLALNAGTGAQLWVGAVFDSLNNSSPAVANGVVYGDPLGNLVAFDEATGAPLFTSTESIDGGSPIVDSGQVLIADSNSHSLYAYGL